MLNVEIVWDNGNANDLFEFDFIGIFEVAATNFCYEQIMSETQGFKVEKRFEINISGVNSWWDRQSAYRIAANLMGLIDDTHKIPFELDNVRINIEEF